MSEKKYIGKPGKQDDPCWKGYEMVGMKKKGGRKVPNCVPEAADIIAKAKAKIVEAKDPREYGFEGEMAMSQLKGIMNHAKQMHDMLEPSTDLPEWVQSKITLAYDYIQTAADYMATEMNESIDKGLEDELMSQRQGQSGKKWRVTRGNKTVGTYNSKDKADVKAMRHPLNKVVSNEEVEQIDEVNMKVGDHVATFEKSKFHKNGYRPHLKNPQGKTSYLSSKSYKTPEHAAGEAAAYHKGYTSGPGRASERGADDAVRAYRHKNKEHMHEELGKDNEWGRPELRKKYAAATPGQESLAADKIPTFDPRYDDVTTQYSGLLRPVSEGILAEISARGAVARDKFRAKIKQTLSDPKKIARAKKVVAKQKAAAKAAEAPHLVMQLRKAVSIGSKVQFQDGQHHNIAPNHADRFMSKYNSARTSIEKEALQKRAHKSHSEFMKAIAEEFHENCGTPDCCQTCETAEMGTHHVDSYEAHKGSGDRISPVISHDDDDIRFQDFDEEAFEKELEADVHSLSWEDLVDFYDDEELEYIEDGEEEEELEEGISPQGRLKKKFAAMRSKTRRNMARNLALKRVSTPARVKSRSIRAARRMVYKRLLRNRDISTVSAAEKTRLEAQIKRMAPMVARLSVRIMPKVRKMEQSRIKNSRSKKKK